MATNEKRLILRVPPATYAHFRIVAKQYCDGNLSEALRQALALYRQCWLQVREGFDIFLRSLEADGKYHVHHRVAVSAKCLPAPSAPKVPFKEIQATWTNEEMQAAQAMIDAGAARSRHDLAALAFGLLDHVRNQQSQGRQLSAIMDGQVKVLSDNWVVVEAAPPAVPGELYPPGTLLRTKDQRLNYEATRRRPNQIFLLTGLFDMGFDAPTNVVVSNNMLWHGSEYLVGINGGPGLQQEITRLRTAASQLAAGLPWSKFKNPEHLRKFRDLLDEVDPDDEIRLWCDPDNGEEHTSPVYLLLKYVVDPANCLAGRETDYNVPRPSWMFRTEHGVEGIFFTTENSRIVSGLVQYPEHLHRCSDLLQHLYLQARRLPTLDGGTPSKNPKRAPANQPMLTENLDHVGPVRLPLDWRTHQVKKPRLDFYEKDGCHYLTALLGEITPDKTVLVRVQSACAMGDIWGSCYCDCAWQFAEAKRRIFEAADGLVVYCYDQHGKGIGLRDHYRVYAEGQPRGEKLLRETFERLGFSFENRRYVHVCDILKAIGVRRMKLMTNDPARLKTFTDAGFEVERQSLVPPLDEFNREEWEIKVKYFGHLGDPA